MICSAKGKATRRIHMVREDTHETSRPDDDRESPGGTAQRCHSHRHQSLKGRPSLVAEAPIRQAPETVNTTPHMTCFRGAKVCTKWLQGTVMMN